MNFQAGVPFGPSTFGPAVSGLPNLTATGTDLASAYLISATDSVFTNVPAGTGCRLPTPSNQPYTIYNYGTNVLLIYPSGGDKIAQLQPGQPIALSPNNSFVFSSFNSALTPLPRQWYVTGGSSNTNANGDVVGPNASTAGDIAMFSDTSGKVIADSGIPSARIVQGPTVAVAGDIAAFGASGQFIADSGVPANKVVQGPTVAGAGNLVSFSGTGGRLVQDTGIAAANVVQTSGGATISAAMKPVVVASTLSLARQAMGVDPAHGVLMYYDEGTSAWVVITETGAALDLTGTVTDGLQEAINYVTRYGQNFTIVGGGIVPATWPPPFNPSVTPGNATHGVINIGAPIIVPAIQGGTWKFEAVTFNYTGGPASTTSWTWDSMELFSLDSTGSQWVGNTSNILMNFVPTNPWPEDTFGPANASCYIKLGAMVNNGAGPTCRIDATHGPTGGCIFEFTELNAGSVGLQLLGATHGVQANIIRIPFAHAQTSICVALGLSTADASTVTGNIIDLVMSGANGSVVGLSVFGSKNLVRVSGFASLATGVKFESSAALNVIDIGNMDATTVLQDLSTSQDNYVVGCNARGTNQNNTHTSVKYLPDGTIIQTIDNAASSTGGVSTAFPVTFGKMQSCVATPTNQAVAYMASATTSGVTITVASGTPNFNVVAVGFK